MERDFNVNWVTRCSKINRRERFIDAFHCVDISKEDDNEVELENDQQHMQDLWEEFEVLDCGNGANEAKKNNVFDVDLKLIEEWLEEPIYDNEDY